MFKGGRLHDLGRPLIATISQHASAKRLFCVQKTSRGFLLLKPYIVSVAVACGGLLIALLIELSLGVGATSRVFLVVVLISAVAYGLWPAVFASLISAIAYDYFFLPPVYSLEIASNQGIVDFGLFVVLALVVSMLAARVRRYALLADQRALTAESLSAFTQHLADATSVEKVLHNAAEQMSELLGGPVALILTEADFPTVNAASPPGPVPDAECLRSAVAWWALSSEESRRQGYKVGEWRFRTLRGADESLGLIATKAECYGTSTGAVQDTLLDALTHQTGLALERCMLHDRLEQSRMKGETERLRLTVLTSISHDVRHPLASITASASVLDRQWATLADTSKLLMLRTIRNEAERLSDFIDKLLNLTSIESKILQTDCRRVDIADVVEAALQQASARFAGHRIELVIPEDLPPVWSDPVLLQQVLYNLIDNAVKYSQPASSIRIVACEDNQSVTVNILDEGTGLPNADLERIFDRFYRTPSAERQASGTGLGLAICRGFIEIMSGTIEAANRDDRTGSVFKISLPIAIHQELQEVEL